MNGTQYQTRTTIIEDRERWQKDEGWNDQRQGYVLKDSRSNSKQSSWEQNLEKRSSSGENSYLSTGSSSNYGNSYRQSSNYRFNDQNYKYGDHGPPGRSNRGGRGRGRGQRRHFSDPEKYQQFLRDREQWISEKYKEDNQDPFEKEKKFQHDLQRIHQGTNGLALNKIDFSAYEDAEVRIENDQGQLERIQSFDEQLFDQQLGENIRRCGFDQTTPIQSIAIPLAMKGRDIMACAQTGSGKTAAYCLPLINQLIQNESGNNLNQTQNFESVYPYAIVLCPTRELCQQIFNELRKFTHQTKVSVGWAYGGVPYKYQVEQLQNKGCNILVATTGRLLQLLRDQIIKLRLIEYLVIDEADRMLELGSEDDMNLIQNNFDMNVSVNRQTFMFSATFPLKIQHLARQFLKQDYVYIYIGKQGSTTQLIQQKIEFYDKMDSQTTKFEFFQTICSERYDEGQKLVFVDSKNRADFLCTQINKSQLGLAISIHADRTQQEREQALQFFRLKRYDFLIATDVASRGLDIPNVNYVIVYDMPKDINDYIHRIGRTGRAGRIGVAVAILTIEDLNVIQSLVRHLELSFQDVPEWLVNIAETQRIQQQKLHGNDFGQSDPRPTEKQNGQYKEPYNSSQQNKSCISKQQAVKNVQPKSDNMLQIDDYKENGITFNKNYIQNQEKQHNYNLQVKSNEKQQQIQKTNVQSKLSPEEDSFQFQNNNYDRFSESPTLINI